MQERHVKKITYHVGRHATCTYNKLGEHNIQTINEIENNAI
jgi:hypothetical protein